MCRVRTYLHPEIVSRIERRLPRDGTNPALQNRQRLDGLIRILVQDFELIVRDHRSGRDLVRLLGALLPPDAAIVADDLA